MNSKVYELIREQVYSDRLPGGMPVYVVRKRGYNKLSAGFATNYGGADRRFKLGGEWIDTPEGVAHFLEHKMFDTEDGNALAVLSANGAQPNAYTSSDITLYHFEGTEKFEENLKVLLEFVSVPYFTAESVEKEQGIIAQEIRMYEDHPGSELFYSFMKLLFRHNPARDSVAGTVESIAQITDKTLYDCHKIFYHPSNMALVVVGDIDPETVFDLARSTLPEGSGPTPQRDYGEPESLTPVAERSERRMEVSEPIYVIGSSATYPARGADRLRQELVGDLATTVIGGKSSPMYFRLYAEGLIKPGFSCGYESVAGVALTAFEGTGEEYERVFEEVRKESARIAAEGIDEALFARIKKAKYGALIRSLDSFDRIRDAHAAGFFKGYDSFRAAEVLQEITAAEVTEFIREFMKPENMVISVVLPLEDNT